MLNSGRQVVDGFVVWALAFGADSAYLAEVLAIELGLRQAWDLSYKEVDCLSDYSNAVNGFSSDVDVSRFWAREKIQRVRTCLSEIGQLWLILLPGVHRNNAADLMAKQASHERSLWRVWHNTTSLARLSFSIHLVTKKYVFFHENIANDSFSP